MAAALDKLEHLHRLDEEDRSFVRQGSRPSERFAAGADICRDGMRPLARVITSGWAARLRILPDGRRQIFGFLVPGDMIGVQPHIVIPSAVTAMTVVQTADVSMLRGGGVPLHPALVEAFASAGDMDEALLLNQIVRLGLQTPVERLTHLFLELAERLDAVVEQDQCRFPFPLTQESLADALGLSVVHINRTLQQMRHDGLVHIRSGEITLSQLGRQSLMCDFTFGQIWKAERRLPAARILAVA
jgi:CRP-like cAMP-binding protein